MDILASALHPIQGNQTGSRCPCWMLKENRGAKTWIRDYHGATSNMSVDQDGVELDKLTGSESPSRGARVGSISVATHRRFSLMPNFLPFPFRDRLCSETSRNFDYSRISGSPTQAFAATTLPRKVRSFSSSEPSTRCQGDMGSTISMAPSSSKSPSLVGKFERSLLPTAAANISSASTLCRICYSDDIHEELTSPCQCSGSMSFVHKSCLERWLSSTSTDCCDLCHYPLPVQRIPKSFCEFLSEERHIRRPFFSDTCCMLILAPMICISTYLCITGATEFLDKASEREQKIFIKTNKSTVTTVDKHVHHFVWSIRPAGESDYMWKWEAYGLIVIAGLLLGIYLLWASLSVRYYVQSWRNWRVTRYRIVLLETTGQVARYLRMPSPTLPSPQTSEETIQDILADNSSPLSIDCLSVTSIRNEALPSPEKKCIQKSSHGNSSTSKVPHHESSQFFCVEIQIQSASSQVDNCESFLEIHSPTSVSLGINSCQEFTFPQPSSVLLKTTSPITTCNKSLLTKVNSNSSSCSLHRKEVESTKM
ncbi:uncharacterized protein LOC143041653 [Oratosquilla oratoria]|uniref:uncharacterized protein LOC143041653 n=1 Tax=Oratosquilla oratoria TaxID=337810 RepID=UPI003F75D56A